MFRFDDQDIEVLDQHAICFEIKSLQEDFGRWKEVYSILIELERDLVSFCRIENVANKKIVSEEFLSGPIEINESNVVELF